MSPPGPDPYWAPGGFFSQEEVPPAFLSRESQVLTQPGDASGGNSSRLFKDGRLGRRQVHTGLDQKGLWCKTLEKLWSSAED